MKPNQAKWLKIIGVVVVAALIAFYLPEKYTIMKPKTV